MAVDQAPTLEFATAPRMGGLYRAAAVGALRRGRPAALPDVALVQRAVAVDVDHLAAYNRICGFRLGDTLPLTYPHVLAFPLALALMTRRDFPLPVVGLVHVANRVEALAPLTIGDRLTLLVRAAGLGPHPSGRQVDIVTEVHVDGACAWREHATYLRRGARRTEGQPSPVPSPDRETAAATGAIWPVPADAGIRYARVSGDRNPIHTSRLAARLFGFRRRIAHGMWTAARCLAALEGRLPTTVRAEVRFQRPVPLPARVGYAANPAGAGWALALTPAGGGRSYLTGTVTPLG